MYTAPIKDLRFVLEQLLGADAPALLASSGDYSAELGAEVLEQAGLFAAGVLDPLNAVGDRAGARMSPAGVSAPPQFRAAYAQYIEAGWPQLAVDTELGGQGAPRSLASAVEEIWFGANMAFMLCPMLTRGAIEALQLAGPATLSARFLPPLVSGAWSATMNLTESQAGSDLGAIRMSAVADGDRYRLRGQKIFITYGEHDLSENILHLVLARIDGAPAGVRGISLFLVPRYLTDDTGRRPNDVRCLSIEHKLGIHASPTCVMAYGEHEGAVGYLLGEPNQGLQYMFVMMNSARLGVGIQAVGLAERALQQARSWASARTQGHPAGEPGTAASAIVHHPDVRRMLLSMKAGVEAMRALALYTAAQLDRARSQIAVEARAAAQARAELLTPIVKGWCTEFAIELISLGVQIHGGMGYIEETGIAQTLRDARITSIYEGTTGIQGNDLLARKLGRDGGAAMRALIAEARQELEALLSADVPGTAGAATTKSTVADAGTAADIAAALNAVDTLHTATGSLLEQLAANPGAAYAVAVPYLLFAGFTLGGWLTARAAAIASRQLACGAQDAPFWRAKHQTARFYAAQFLPRAAALAQVVRNGGPSVAESDPDLV